jgi:hypothetical protein
MVARPLMQFGVQELSDHSTRGDFERKLVLEELEFRTTRAARRLKESLMQAGTVSTPQKPNETTNNSRERPPKKPQGGSRPEQGQPAPGCARSGVVPRLGGVDTELTSRFEILRATFTVEGEILARWGLTEEIPPEIEDEVFSLWRKKLSDSPDNRNRTRRQLEEDLERLAAERSQRDIFLGKSADGS